MLEVKRKKNESFESLMRRFRKQVQMSGKTLQAKKVQFRRPVKSENIERASTLIRLKRKALITYQQKVGKTTASK